VTTEFVSWPPPCTGGNKACGVFSQKLNSGGGGERPRGAGSGAPLARREGLWLSTKLLDQGAWPSCGLPFSLGHQLGLVGTLVVPDTSVKILASLTRVYISTLLFTFRIYIKYLSFNLAFLVGLFRIET
jgi:hypothetical protein